LTQLPAHLLQQLPFTSRGSELLEKLKAWAGRGPTQNIERVEYPKLLQTFPFIHG
jgi:hypothetical protein